MTTKDIAVLVFALIALPLFSIAGGLFGGTAAPGSGGLPAGCTDNTIARADGAAGATQCSSVTIDDEGDLGMGTSREIAFTTSLLFKDPDGNTMATLTDGGTTSVLSLGGSGSTFKAHSFQAGSNGATFVLEDDDGGDYFSAVEGAATTVISQGDRLLLSPASTFGVDLTTTGSKVACASGHSGSLFYENTVSDSTVSKLYICSEKADNTFAWGEVTVVIP